MTGPSEAKKRHCVICRRCGVRKGRSLTPVFGIQKSVPRHADKTQRSSVRKARLGQFVYVLRTRRHRHNVGRPFAERKPSSEITERRSTGSQCPKM